jgi:hypothetical protein
MALEKMKGRRSHADKGAAQPFQRPFLALAGVAFSCPESGRRFFPEGVVRGGREKNFFSKEDGAPKEGKKNLWDGPGAKPAGCPFFGGGRKGRLFCF